MAPALSASPGALAAAAAARVPATDAVWHCYVHKLRTWAPLGDPSAPPSTAPPPDDDAEVEMELVRPHLLLLVSVADGAFLSCAAPDGSAETNVLTSAEPPTADDVLAFLCRAMAAPRVLNASMRGGPECVRRALRALRAPRHPLRALRAPRHPHPIPFPALFALCGAAHRATHTPAYPRRAHATPAARRCAGARPGGRSGSAWRTLRLRARCAARPNSGLTQTHAPTSTPAAPPWRRWASRRG
jgi:hypothetical protein